MEKKAKTEEGAPGIVTPAKSGLLFVVSAPSGAGKTTLCHAVRQQFPDLRYSVSYTTRRPRQGERDGVDYHFVSEDAFKEGMAQGRWAEWARVYGNFYGTSAQWIRSVTAEGYDILLDIDVQGAGQIVEKFPASVTIFIMPPSMETLQARLEGRGSEKRADLDLRLQDAQKEMAARHTYRHVIVNDELEQAIETLTQLIAGYRADRES